MTTLCRSQLLAPILLIVFAACSNNRPSSAPLPASSDAGQVSPSSEEISETSTGEVPGPEVTDAAASDAAKIACARIEATSGGPELVSLEGMATEGGWAEVFKSDGVPDRIRGGLLFETSRFYFDYVYQDGQLLCARETLSNINVMSEDEPGWEHFWHDQHLAFSGEDAVSVARDHTSGAADRGNEPVQVREFAAEVYAHVQADR